jgi:hypothetical protein
MLERDNPNKKRKKGKGKQKKTTTINKEKHTYHDLQSMQPQYPLVERLVGWMP